MDKQASEASKWIKHRIVPIFLCFVVAFYIFYSTVDIGLADYTAWLTFSVKIVITLIFGLLITSLTGEGGYTAGKEDSDYIETRKLAVEYSNQILPYKEMADVYVSKQIDNKVRITREIILKGYGLKYDEVFNEEGICIFNKHDKKYNRKQRKAVRKAKSIVKKPFDLLAYSDSDALGLEDAPSEAKRRNHKNSLLIGSRVVMAIVSGSIMFSFVGWSLESFIYTMSQLFIWLGSGLLERLSNFNFIVVNVRNYDKERISYMKSFLALSDEEKNKYKEVTKDE